MYQHPEDLANHVEAYLREKNKPLPPPGVLTSLFETLFFASLRKEEGQPVSCRIAFVDRKNPDPHAPNPTPATRWRCFALSKELPFTVPNVVKLSQAVDPWGSTLAVDANADNKLAIWGLIDQAVHFSTFVVREEGAKFDEVIPVDRRMPGVFQVAIEGVGEVSAYNSNVLVGRLKHGVLLKQQQRVFAAGPIHSRMLPWMANFNGRVEKLASPFCKQPYSKHLSNTLSEFWFSSLCRLLIGIHRYGHGGAVLISDDRTDLKVKYSINYPRFSDAVAASSAHRIRRAALIALIYHEYVDRRVKKLPVSLFTQARSAGKNLENSYSELKGCVRFLTSLSRVDGLLWLNTDLSLRGFGVEIATNNDPSSVYVADDLLGDAKRALMLDSLGMRHRSMLRYCGLHENAVGFVVSQDGDVRAIAKVNDDVLLWESISLHAFRTPIKSKV